jgi:dephospho-CoA kinase
MSSAHFNESMIIGITGTIGAGKGTVVEYLVKQKGFTHYSVRAFLSEEIIRRGMPVNRDSTTLVANEFRAKYGPAYIAEELLRQAKATGGNSVIESLRSVGEVEMVKSQPEAYVLAVDADVKLRYERILARKSALDYVSFEEFLAHEKREMTSNDPTKQNLSGCIKLADVLLMNNGSMEELFDATAKALEKLSK